MALLFIVFLFLIDGVIGEYCFKSFMVTQYCSFGCCGEGHYKTCCSSTGPIIGIAVGLSVVLLIIIVCCCLCKRQATRGRVLQQQQPAGYNTNTGPQQPVTYTQQQSGVPTYVYPTASVGPAIPGAVGGYPYQQQYMGQVPPPQPPPGSYQQPQPQQQQPGFYQQPQQQQQPGFYPQHGPTTSYQHQQQMPAYNYDNKSQPVVEPSAPPPSYEEAQKYIN